MSILKLEHVFYRYPKASEFVLKDVNCAFEKGQINAIVGSSGSGKTTILSLLAGLDVPTEGEIILKGESIRDMDPDEYRREKIAITATGQDNYHRDFFPFLEGFDHCHGGDLETLAELADHKVCAVMIELIQGEGGVIPLDKEYVEGIAKLCRERDVLLIIDEVQTGGGRTGSFFAYQQYGVEPDLVTFAKGIGGGLPIGGVLFNEKTADVLSFGDHGTTYGGNPIACAGALAVLKKVTPQLLDSVREKGEYMREKLRTMEKVEDVVGMGLMIGVKLKEIAPGEVVDQCREKGLLVLTAGDKVRLLPPLNISSHDIRWGLEIVEEVLG